ncbi:MAG: hypothetical protein KJO07_06870 [Deltaproteobacteria bacterium]|nr:hypothetical protein [Deltaproteobacteria bacterium]
MAGTKVRPNHEAELQAEVESPEQVAPVVGNSAQASMAAQVRATRMAGREEPSTEEALEVLETEAEYLDKDTTAFVKGDGDSRAIHSNDVAQGLTGDCWWMASLAAIADTNFKLIEDAVEDHGNGTYTVTLYDHERGEPTPKEYLVTELVPVLKKDIPDDKMDELGLIGKQATDAGDWAFAQPGDVSDGALVEIWPLLFEKAMIQHLEQSRWTQQLRAENEDGFALMNVGQMVMGLQSLSDESGQMRSTTGRAELAEARGMRGPSELGWDEFSEMWSAGFAVTVGTWGGWDLHQHKDKLSPETQEALQSFYEDGNLTSDHAYWISEVDLGSQMLTIKNPWGSHLEPLVMPWEDFQWAFHTISVVPTGDRR